MNYSIPVTKVILSDKDLMEIKKDVNDIIDQQLLILKLSESITFSDTQDMDTYERIYDLNKLLKMKKEENEARERAYKDLNK